MKRKALPKLIIVVSLVATLAIVVPMMSGCLGKPAVAPPEAPPEVAPPEVAPAEEVQTWHLRYQSCRGRSIAERDSGAQFCDRVTKMTGGRVTFDLYAGGELMPSEEEIPALKAGTMDMNYWYPLMGTVTDLNVIECGAPFATKNAMEFRTLIYHRGLFELIAESYEEQGLVYLGPGLADPLEICMTSPAYSLDDLKGKRIQLLKEHAYPYVQAGVSCMPTPPADVYLALQTGTLDGVGWSGADEITMFGWNEVAPYLIDPPLVDVCSGCLLVNPDVWASMPEDIQEIIRVAWRSFDLYDEGIRASGEWQRRTDGSFKEVCHLPEEDIEVLRAYGMEYLVNEVALRSARCAKAVQIILDFRAEVDEANWYGH